MYIYKARKTLTTIKTKNISIPPKFPHTALGGFNGDSLTETGKYPVERKKGLNNDKFCSRYDNLELTFSKQTDTGNWREAWHFEVEIRISESSSKDGIKIPPKTKPHQGSTGTKNRTWEDTENRRQEAVKKAEKA